MHKIKKENIYIIIITFLLVGIHTVQYILSGYSFPILLRVVMYAIFGLSVLFIGKKALYIDLIIFSLIAAYFNSFINFTSFFVILMSCRIYRQTESWVLMLYAINQSIAMMVQNYEISHLIIHFLTCAFFYIIYFYINKPKLLDLTEDERAILEEMKNGKLQKEITLFSKNIVTKKLQDAKTRNHIATTEELLAKYSVE